MSLKPYLSVVIPAYNEEKNIRRTLERLALFFKEQAWTGETVVVDDGSTDKTAKIVKDFGRTHFQVRLIRKKHRGKGCAVRAGVLAATGSFILFSDADLAVDIKEVKRLLLWATEHNFDIVIGSREGLGARRLNEPFYRHLMGRGFNLIVKILLLGGFEDTQCGFKLFKEKAAKDVFSRLVLYGEEAPAVDGARVTAFDVEVLFLAKKRGYKVKEVPTVWEHVKTQRVHPLKDSWRMFLDVLKIRLNNLRGVYQ